LRKILPGLRKIRREIHRHPEPKFQEFATAELIERELAGIGVPTKRLGRTGVVGLLKGGRAGQTIALRADIDALRMKELTSLPYASVNDCMHACGHDGHTAILIGVAKVLAPLAKKLTGNVKLIFQPAEEGGAGAKVLCDQGVMTRPKVRAIFALHCFNDAPVGSVAVIDGPITACADQFTITVTGSGAHGAYPHRGVDPILVSARIVDSIQSIVSRELSPLRPGVVTIGTIHGGTAENIIPETVEMTGTLRALDPDTRSHLISSLRRIATRTARAMNARASVRMHTGYPVTCNDKDLNDVVRKVARNVLGPRKVIELGEPAMGAEDFSFYLDHAPGVFFRLGTGDGTGKQAPAHNPYFNFNDRALGPGVKMFVGIVGEMLSGRANKGSPR